MGRFPGISGLAQHQMCRWWRCRRHVGQMSGMRRQTGTVRGTAEKRSKHVVPALPCGNGTATRGANMLFRTIMEQVMECTGGAGPGNHTAVYHVDAAQGARRPVHECTPEIRVIQRPAAVRGRSAGAEIPPAGGAQTGAPKSRRCGIGGRTRGGRYRPERAGAAQCCQVQLRMNSSK